MATSLSVTTSTSYSPRANQELLQGPMAKDADVHELLLSDPSRVSFPKELKNRFQFALRQEAHWLVALLWFFVIFGPPQSRGRFGSTTWHPACRKSGNIAGRPFLEHRPILSVLQAYQKSSLQNEERRTMTVPSVPEGGITKRTQGIWIQVFDADGRRIGRGISAPELAN